MPHLTMSPRSGEWLLRYVGDRVHFKLHCAGNIPPDWTALLRTDLGRAASARAELIATLGGARTFAGSSWRDIPLERVDGGWAIDLPLTEVGWFRAKPYARDAQGRQHWPDGEDLGITVHPDSYRTANTIYCAFVRTLGATRHQKSTHDEALQQQLQQLDQNGYAVIPPSGKLRDLVREIPHIVSRLGCRIIHLLPITTTPTTYARYGRFGSPYAACDLTDIDLALVEYDRKTTAVDQFREVTYAAHLRDARVFLDIVVNHTGWGARLLAAHPEFFKRAADGTFHSPGAWGTTWEDLVELDNRFPGLWEEFAAALITWCRRGVDGFRCDAGYMVPQKAWQYIIGRVRDEFPDTVFLLEGLGGAWEATEKLLTQGGMQWAYSELFQNYSPREVSSYLDHVAYHGKRVGVLVHYSETHDNDRLAKQGRRWSLLRNQLAALTSQSGAFGFTSGVEWLATEKIEVHQSRGLNWDSSDHIIEELKALNALLGNHPCFFDGATLIRLSPPESAVLALARRSAEGHDQVLVLINTDASVPAHLTLKEDVWRSLGEPRVDLLGQNVPPVSRANNNTVAFLIPPGHSYCLSRDRRIVGLAGDIYRTKRAQTAWAYSVLTAAVPHEDIGPCDWRELAAWVSEDAVRFLGALAHLDPTHTRRDLLGALREAAKYQDLPRVTQWERTHLRSIVLVPASHWLLVRDRTPFAATLQLGSDRTPLHQRSVLVADEYVVCFPPRGEACEADLLLEPFAEAGRQAQGRVRFLAPAPEPHLDCTHKDGIALLTNGRGGMARLGIDLGAVQSKYDCLLGANLHPSAPVDRHVLCKRMRVWVNADGFITPLDHDNLIAFSAGPPATWTFVANAGDRRAVQITLVADMLQGKNTTVLRFARPQVAPPPPRRELPGDREVRLIVRMDIEDRSFHAETHRSPSIQEHFERHTRRMDTRIGFAFTPGDDRQLHVYADSGQYYPQAEWCQGIAHPIEATRGMPPAGDAWSPGWFELPIMQDAAVTLVATADPELPSDSAVADFVAARNQDFTTRLAGAGLDPDDRFGQTLGRGVLAYVVRRGAGPTVVAGYPWFLDWGRDTFIAARGLLAAGLHTEVRQILQTFGRFESGGTLPNMLHGEDASNRDTSDASLWYGVVCEETAALLGRDLYTTPVAGGGRTLAEVLVSIANGYLRGTPNGIRVDPASALVWSPSHFTWMDTNYPAGTPRAGYPIEIQALWIRLLRLLDHLGMPAPHAGSGDTWSVLAERARQCLIDRYWLPEHGWFADQLVAPDGRPAAQAEPDTALRPNFLLGISLGLIRGERAQQAVQKATHYLLVPGGMRSLAPLPVSPHLPIRIDDGPLLNDPERPYWGRYEGDEDTRRKPAYHNGTAWTWVLPVYCEALARAWNFADEAVATARAYLGSLDAVLSSGTVGQLPEIVDGDAPHQERGCDAQAWSVTEALRVWKLLDHRGRR